MRPRVPPPAPAHGAAAAAAAARRGLRAAQESLSRRSIPGRVCCVSGSFPKSEEPGAPGGARGCPPGCRDSPPVTADRRPWGRPSARSRLRCPCPAARCLATAGSCPEHRGGPGRAGRLRVHPHVRASLSASLTALPAPSPDPEPATALCRPVHRTESLRCHAPPCQSITDTRLCVLHT